MVIGFLFMVPQLSRAMASSFDDVRRRGLRKW